MERRPVQLQGNFSLFQAVAIVSGLIIGTGIYVAPTGVLLQVSSPGVALIIWASAGIIATISGLVYAELGTTYPRCGDSYIYLEIFYGEMVAFLHFYQFFFITRTASNSIKCLLAATYLIQYFYPDCPAPEQAIKLLAMVLIGIVTFMNCVDVVLSGKMQGACFFVTVSSLLIIIGFGFVDLGHGKTENFQNMFAGAGDISVANVTLALYSSIFAFGGWFALNHVIEEIKQPEKTVPRAVIITMATVMTLYLLVNVAFMTVLNVDEIKQSQAIAITFSEKKLGGASFVIAIMIAVSNCGSLNSGVLIASRIGFAAARRGHMPAVLGLISLRSYAPVVALVAQMFITLLMVAVADIYSLLNNTQMLNCASQMLVSVGLVYTRVKQPNLLRPFKMPMVFLILYCVISTSLVFGPLLTRPYDTGIGILITVTTGIPYYLIFVKQLIPLGFLHGVNQSLVVLTQKLLWCAPQNVA